MVLLLGLGFYNVCAGLEFLAQLVACVFENRA